MSQRSVNGRDWVALARLGLLIGLGVAISVLCLMAAELVRFLPNRVIVHSTLSKTVAVAALLFCMPAVFRLIQAVFGKAAFFDWVLRRSDIAGRWILSQGLAPAVALVAILLFAIWLPHYVFCPWSRDSDTFATLALSWNAGVIPYRDIEGYNFPGHTYLFWLIGSIFGWGRAWALYLCDAAMLFGFGLALGVWSKRVFKTAVPGIVSGFWLFLYYSSLDFQVFAQRDWHATLAILSAILVVQLTQTRQGRIFSSALAAIGFTIRPHVIAFLPAILYALHESASRAAREADAPVTQPRPAFGRRAIEWLGVFVVLDLLAFTPVVLAGALPGFVHGLSRIVFSGLYGQVDASSVQSVLSDATHSPQTWVTVPWLALIAIRGPAGLRSIAITWLLALVGAVLYRLPHPVQHNYLGFPLIVTRYVAVAVGSAWLFGCARIPPLAKLPTACAVGMVLLLGTEQRIHFGAARLAVATMFSGGRIPTEPPPGSFPWFHSNRYPRYDWPSYRAALLYLRDHTAPDAVVANVLRSLPFPAINGPVGRLSPFRVESGICWMWLVHEDRDAQFADELENSSCEVVVWSQGPERDAGKLPLPRLCRVIQTSFELEAKFGVIEIWRRRRPAGATRGDLSGLARPKKFSESLQRLPLAPG